METTKVYKKDIGVSEGQFNDAIRKIHESETKPIKIIGDEGAPTIREVINNQKRLAIMIEYLAKSKRNDYS